MWIHVAKILLVHDFLESHINIATKKARYSEETFVMENNILNSAGFISLFQKYVLKAMKKREEDFDSKIR